MQMRYVKHIDDRICDSLAERITLQCYSWRGVDIISTAAWYAYGACWGLRVDPLIKRTACFHLSNEGKIYLAILVFIQPILFQHFCKRWESLKGRADHAKHSVNIWSKCVDLSF